MFSEGCLHQEVHFILCTLGAGILVGLCIEGVFGSSAHSKAGAVISSGSTGTTTVFGDNINIFN